MIYISFRRLTGDEWMTTVGAMEYPHTSVVTAEAHTLSPNTTYPRRVNALWLAFDIAGFLVLSFLAITYIVIILMTARLRRSPGKWLQMVVAVSIVMDAFWYVVAYLMWMTSDAMRSRSTCLAMLSSVWTGVFMIGIGGNLLTLERLISVWRQDYRVAGFAERETSVAILVSVIVTLILVMALLCGLGSPVVTFSKKFGIHHCSPTARSSLALNITIGVMECVMFVLTLLLAARLCRSRRQEAEPYPYQHVLHVLLGNCALFLNEAAIYIQKNHFNFVVNIIMLFYVVLLLLWLLLDCSVRVPLRRRCCPLCPGPEPFGDRVELVEEEWFQDFSTDL